MQEVNFYGFQKVRPQASKQGLADVSHSCSLLEYGAVKCWGRNNYGQLGIVGSNERGGAFDKMGEQLPIVYLGEKAVQLELLWMASCVLLVSGNVKCWGWNDQGSDERKIASMINQNAKQICFEIMFWIVFVHFYFVFGLE